MIIPTNATSSKAATAMVLALGDMMSPSSRGFEVLRSRVVGWPLSSEMWMEGLPGFSGIAWTGDDAGVCGTRCRQLIAVFLKPGFWMLNEEVKGDVGLLCG